MILFLVLYTTWVWAGLRPSFHVVGVGVAGILLLLLAVGSNRAIWKDRARDPVTWLGLAFLGLLSLQWTNAGRIQYYDIGYHRWMYLPPRWPGWPWAFHPDDARQMLSWFFPAWVLVLTLRAPIWSPRTLRQMFMTLTTSASLLALFGIVQYLSGTRSIYWIQPLKSHFFASFAYGNHAPPFFVLMSALIAGLLYREIFDARLYPADMPSAEKIRHPLRVVGLTANFFLCLVGAFLGFSRTGIVLASLLALFVLGYGWLRSWKILSAAGRINFVAGTLAVAGVLFMTIVTVGESGLRREFRLIPSPPDAPQHAWEHVDRELGRRPQFILAALKIWREHPWVGVGGWGYKYLVAEKVPQKFWPALEKRGWANVHCDPAQFLAEFGLVGFSLILAIVAVIARDLFRPECRRHALWLMGVTGLGCVLLFSLIDLPFRSPAILYTWVSILTILPGVCCSRAANSEGNGHPFSLEMPPFFRRPVPVHLERKGP